VQLQSYRLRHDYPGQSLLFTHKLLHCMGCYSRTKALSSQLLLQGLAKLQKTQKDVDVLVEEAKIKTVEVEKKVAGADAFAEQVSHT